MSTNESPRSTYKPDGYTKADQDADRAFLVGAAYGRSAERERIAKAIEANWAGDEIYDACIEDCARIAREGLRK